MNKSMKAIALLVGASMIGLTGCSTNTQSQNTALGVVGGAIVGGGIGAAVSAGAGGAIAAGAVVGGVIGGVIGYNMDHTDKVYMYQAMDTTPVHHHKHWKNHKTHRSYVVTPTSKVFAYHGYNFCRNYTVVSYYHGQKQQVQGIACRQKDGSWTHVN